MKSPLVSVDIMERLHDHSFTARVRRIPATRSHGSSDRFRLGQVNHSVGCSNEQFGVSSSQFPEDLHMPLVVLVGVDEPLAGEQVEGRELQIQQ